MEDRTKAEFSIMKKASKTKPRKKEVLLRRAALQIQKQK
jgi:hypothetical protein